MEQVFQTIIHYGGHFIAPALIAWILWRVSMETPSAGDDRSNAIDLDHLLADPIFDPNRCSVGFHLLQVGKPLWLMG